MTDPAEHSALFAELEAIMDDAAESVAADDVAAVHGSARFEHGQVFYDLPEHIRRIVTIVLDDFITEASNPESLVAATPRLHEDPIRDAMTSTDAWAQARLDALVNLRALLSGQSTSRDEVMGCVQATNDVRVHAAQQFGFDEEAGIDHDAVLSAAAAGNLNATLYLLFTGVQHDLIGIVSL